MTVPKPQTMIMVRELEDLPKRKLKPGHVVVHNQVAPNDVFGMNGFRVWVAKPVTGKAVKGSFGVIRCECGWSPELREHYRVKR